MPLFQSYLDILFSSRYLICVTTPVRSEEFLVFEYLYGLNGGRGPIHSSAFA